MKLDLSFKQDIMVLSAFLVSLLLIFLVVDLGGAFQIPPPKPRVPFNNGGGGGSGTITIVEDRLFDTSGVTNEGGATTYAFEIEYDDVAFIDVTLTWSDDLGDNDRLQLEIAGDNGILQARSSVTGFISFRIICPRAGNYTLRVYAIDCPGMFTSHIGDLDNGNSWDASCDMTREVIS